MQNLIMTGCHNFSAEKMFSKVRKSTVRQNFCFDNERKSDQILMSYRVI